MKKLDLLAVVSRKRLSIIIIVAMFIIVGVIYSFYFVSPMYKSTSTIVLGEQDETFLELAKSKAIMEGVREKVEEKTKVSISVDELLKTIKIERKSSSDLLQLSAVNKDAKVAKSMIISVIEVFAENIRQIYEVEQIYMIDEPKVPTEPYNIHHAVDIAIFTGIGLIVVSIYVVIISLKDNIVRDDDDLESLLEVKTLIDIPTYKEHDAQRKTLISDAFKRLRTNIQFTNMEEKGPYAFMVTSCLPGEGKTYVSANLAVAFAQTGKKVVLVDSDLRHGRLSRVFKVPSKNGLSNYISNIDANGIVIDWNIGEYIRKTKVPHLDIITSGTVPPNPIELLSSMRFADLIDKLKKYYDVIIVDAPPIYPTADALYISTAVGKVLLVTVQNKTKRTDVVRVEAAIDNFSGKIMGTVLNKVAKPVIEYDDNYYEQMDKKIMSKERRHRKIKLKVNRIKKLFTNMFKKIKTSNRRLAPAKTVEVKKKKPTKTQSEKEPNKEVRVKVKVSKPAATEEDKVKTALEAEKAKEEAILAEEKAREEAILAEEKAKAEAEKEKRKEEELREKEKQKQEKIENRLKKKAEKKQKNEEFKKNMEAKKEELQAKKQEYLEKRIENKLRKAEEKVKKEEEKRRIAEEKAAREAEIERLREEERIKKEEAKRLAEEERQRRIAMIAEERAKREAMQAVEKARKEAESIRLREEEKLRKEETRRLLAEEKAKQMAAIAAEKARKEEEEKYSDEYLQANLYPKTKFNKF